MKFPPANYGVIGLKFTTCEFLTDRAQFAVGRAEGGVGVEEKNFHNFLGAFHIQNLLCVEIILTNQTLPLHRAPAVHLRHAQTTYYNNNVHSI